LNCRPISNLSLALFGIFYSQNVFAQNGVPAPAVYAITNAKIEIGNGTILKKGTIVVRNGKIESVGENIVPPADAQIIKGEGLVVLPGFVDGFASRGLKLPAAQAEQDSKPDYATFAPARMRTANRKGVRPEIQAADVLDMTKPIIDAARIAGFTTVFVAPNDGLINGTGALVLLNGQPRRESILRADVAMSMGFRSGGNGSEFESRGYPSSLMGVMAQMRQVFLDAQLYRQTQQGFAKGGAVRPPDDPVLAAMQPLLNNALPVVFDADTENQIVRVMNLSTELKLKPILNGGKEAHKQAQILATRQIPVLLTLDIGAEPGSKEEKGKKGEEEKKPADLPTQNPNDPVTQRPNDPKTDDPITGEAEVETAETELPPVVLADRKRIWKETVGTAAALHKAGVTFAFSTKGMRDVSAFLPNLRKVLQAGLPHDAAIMALSLMPSRIFGVERLLGTLEAGKIASVVVLSGELENAKSKVRYLMIDRELVDMNRAAPSGQTGRNPMPFDKDSGDGR